VFCDRPRENKTKHRYLARSVFIQMIYRNNILHYEFHLQEVAHNRIGFGLQMMGMLRIFAKFIVAPFKCLLSKLYSLRCVL